jgi:hypothetical protein
MKQSIRALSAPPHARAVQPHRDEVPDGTLGRASPDVEIVASQLRVRHSGAVLG